LNKFGRPLGLVLNTYLGLATCYRWKNEQKSDTLSFFGI